MAELAIPLMIAGTVMQAGSSIAAGNAEAAQYNYQARGARQEAVQARAVGQRQALEERRRGAYAISRARALAAASGAGATDPTAIDIMAGIRAEGEYNALIAMASAEDRARGLEANASLLRYQGDQAKQAGYIGALTAGFKGTSSILSEGGDSTLLERYGTTPWWRTGPGGLLAGPV